MRITSGITATTKFYADLMSVRVASISPHMTHRANAIFTIGASHNHMAVHHIDHRKLERNKYAPWGRGSEGVAHFARSNHAPLLLTAQHWRPSCAHTTPPQASRPGSCPTAPRVGISSQPSWRTASAPSCSALLTDQPTGGQDDPSVLHAS